MSSSPLLRLINYAKEFRPTIIVATTYSVLNKLFDIAPEILIGIAVDTVVKQDSSFLGRLGFPDLMTQLWILGVLTFIIWSLESLFEYLYSIKWRNLAQTMQHKMRLEAYDHIQHLDLAYFEERSSGGLMAILNDDVNQLERFLDGGANALIQVFTSVILIGAVFFIIAPSVAWMAILPMPLILFGGFYFQGHLAPLYGAVREKAGDLASRLSNNISGITTIKSFTSENWELAQIEKQSNEYRHANRSAIRLSSAFTPTIRIAVVMGFIATLTHGGYLVFKGELGVGAYSILVFLTQRLLWPLTRLAEMADQYQRAMASVNRILGLLETPMQIESGGKSIKPSEVKGEIRFDKITFAYPRHTALLDDFSLIIPAGSTVGFVGATGSGKTTLVKLLLRFYDPIRGDILIDGMPYRDFNIQDLRRCIGLVSQDVFLFQGTVAENIAYGSNHATTEQIRRAAQMAEADQFISRLPEGYQTIVGERGQKLSGGQRQRISIARAILKDPPILILDEATSAVDNETEAAIQKALDKIVSGRTTIMIAHRLSTLRNCDQIFVMEDGKILEAGTHSSLLQANSQYAALWKVQTGMNTVTL